MAETKTGAPRERGKAGKPSKKRTTKPRKASSSRSSNGASASRKRSTSSRAKNGGSHKNGATHVESARKVVEETAKQTGHSVGDAGRSVGRAASKAKTPLLAGSAALAGVAGGIALGTRQARHGKALARRPKVRIGPKVKIDSHDLAKAAKEVGQFGVDVGQLASELRKNREIANGARRRSPIEVVLQGLTTRGSGS
jgi:hypothetical protein